MRFLTHEGMVTGFYTITPKSRSFQPISAKILEVRRPIQKVRSPGKQLVGHREEEETLGSHDLTSLLSPACVILNGSSGVRGGGCFLQ